MNTRVGILLLAGVLAMLPSSRAFAQTCTLGPFTSSTALSSINSQVNSAPNGAVICLSRGQTWSAASGLSVTTSHPTASRVTICASTGSTCSGSGSANPKINITGGANGVVLNGVTGYNFKNIDVFGNNSQNPDGGWAIRKGTAHLTIEGGVIDGWWAPMFADAGGGAILDDAQIGTCANRIEIRGGEGGLPGTGALRTAWWGSLTNSSMSVWIHNFSGAGTGSPAQNHMLDIAGNSSSSDTPYSKSHDCTLECSLIQYSGGNLGSFVKTDRGYNMVYRDNRFESTAAPDGGMALAFDDHDGSGSEGVDGAQVYRNYFSGPYGAIMVGVGANIDIYNNVGNFTMDMQQQRGLVQLWYSVAQAADVQLQHIRIFNNTVYRAGNSTPGAGWPSLVGTNGGPINAGRTLCTTCALYNNLVIDMDSVDAKLFQVKNSCSEFGPNGANIKNNFIYTPGDSSPQMWSGCSGASGTNAAPYNVNPGLVNISAGDFSLSAGSILAGKGIAAGAPSDGDFAKNARQSPPSIGAFDIAVGGVVPLQPPVLIQVSTN